MIEVRNDVSPQLLGPLAYSSGLGEFGMRQADRMQQAQLAYDQMANQQAAQERAIRAQQEGQVFNHLAGQADALQRAVMGEWASQAQFGRSMAADQMNFGQQKQYADYQAQLQDRSWENRLNAEGKMKLAESNRQRDMIDKFDFASPKQKQEALAQWTASQAGLKDPRYFMPEPPSFDEDIKANGKEVEGGWIVRKPDGSWYGINKPVDKDAITKQQIADRQASNEREMQTKIDLAKLARQTAIVNAREKQFDKEESRRDRIYSQEASALRSRTKLDPATDKQVSLYSEDEIHQKAEAEAMRRVPDSRPKWQEFEQDYDAYRKSIGGDTQFGRDDWIPPNFDDIDDPQQAKAVRAEVEAWKKTYGPKQQQVVPQQPPAPQVKDPMAEWHASVVTHTEQELARLMQQYGHFDKMPPAEQEKFTLLRAARVRAKQELEGK